MISTKSKKMLPSVELEALKIQMNDPELIS